MNRKLWKMSKLYKRKKKKRKDYFEGELTNKWAKFFGVERENMAKKLSKEFNDNSWGLKAQWVAKISFSYKNKTTILLKVFWNNF